jgi:branched-chain amino acid transport system substrate-binding protein
VRSSTKTSLPSTSFSPDLHIAVDRPMRVLQVVDGKLVFVEERTPDKVEFLQ